MAIFCDKCGKPLKEGEVCACKAETPSAEPWKTMTSVGSDEGCEVRKGVSEKTKKIVSKIVGEEDKKELSSAWKRFKVRIGVEEPEVSENVYERGMKIVPECISANEGEIPVRQYIVAKMRTIWKLSWAEGRLQVTNKRVIFRAPGRALMGKTILQHEFEIGEIAGIEARKEQRFSLFEAILPILFSYVMMYIFLGIFMPLLDLVPFLSGCIGIGAICAGVIPFFMMHKKFVLKTGLLASAVAACYVFDSYMQSMSSFGHFLMWPVVILWWIALILCCVKTNLVLVIKTKGATGAVEIRRKKPMGLLGFLGGNSASDKEEYTGFNEVFPMKNTEQSIRELGAVISDIQKYGDYGIEKWKED